ncbi:MAG: AAA family ATPase [Flavobacteriales bacterium]|nr:AAA family ATPase [Flavobacteriales bacterium]
MKKYKDLILLRGLPGAGKSELANSLSEDGKHPVYSVDDYFTDEAGNYKFIFEENHKAYTLCQTNTEKSMKEGKSKIILHNTFTLDWEIEPYFDLAKKYNYRVFVLTVENYHGNKNVHQLSDEQIQKMAAKYKVKLI